MDTELSALELTGAYVHLQAQRGVETQFTKAFSPALDVGDAVVAAAGARVGAGRAEERDQRDGGRAEMVRRLLRALSRRGDSQRIGVCTESSPTDIERRTYSCCRCSVRKRDRWSNQERTAKPGSEDSEQRGAELTSTHSAMPCRGAIEPAEH